MEKCLIVVWFRIPLQLFFCGVKCIENKNADCCGGHKFSHINVQPSFGVCMVSHRFLILGVLPSHILEASCLTFISFLSVCDQLSHIYFLSISVCPLVEWIYNIHGVQRCKQKSFLSRLSWWQHQDLQSASNFLYKMYYIHIRKKNKFRIHFAKIQVARFGAIFFKLCFQSGFRFCAYHYF